MWPGNFGARTRQVILRRRIPKEYMSASRYASARLFTIASLVLTLVFTLFAGSVISPNAPKASAMVSAQRADKALDWAKTRKGSPYRYGAMGPGRFDCSGLTRWAYKRIGKSLPHSSAAQAHQVKRISRRNAHRGDLVFFYSRGGVYHVAIFAGHGRIWHSPYSGARVRRDKIWTSRIFFGRVR
jgi:cell wall-associated NlpC family hydrolase